MEFEWKNEFGKIISCTEKNKILNDNMQEIMENIKYAYEDALLMGASQESFYANIANLLKTIHQKS